jgi:hypothetical protein
MLLPGFERIIENLYAEAFLKVLDGRRPRFEDCGSIFADIFGIIYGLKIKKTKLEDGKTVEKLEAVEPPIVKPRHNARIPTLVHGTNFAEMDKLRLVDAIWPVIRGMNDQRDLESRHGKPEYSISLFQDSAALYIGSLGRLLPDNRKKEPIVYTLIPSYASKWRLGRLIDELHTLGTLRLAALRDLSAIGAANEEINKMLISVANTGPGKRPRMGTETLRQKYEGIGKNIEDGLTYRIARSRYYVSSFRDLMALLETKQVEGFQPYNHFVTHRLFDTFDYIDRVGIRHDELQSYIMFLIEANQQQTTNDLLTVAEVFSVIPLTYYAANVSSHVGHELAQCTVLGDGVAACLDWPYYASSFALGSALALGAHWWRHRGTSNAPNNIGAAHAKKIRRPKSTA